MTEARVREFTGRHMLLIMVAFFGVIIAVNTLMAVSASRTWTGLVVQNSYVASQQFQDKADDIDDQRIAGWAFAITYADGTLLLEATGNGRPLALSEVRAFVHRPVGGHDDATVPLEPTPLGYEGRIALAPGVWDVVITTAPTALGVVERETRITVK